MPYSRVTTRLQSYRYEAVAILNGAIIMVLEIVGARIFAPHFGTSIYVWTAVIGVILGALSFGYWYGGRLADRSATDRKLGALVLMAAAVLLITLFLKDEFLVPIAGLKADLRLEAFLAAILLFAPVNILMGIVSPYLVKLKLTSLDNAGSSVGALYAAGTLGSILGTFAAGYWLIGWLGNRALGIWLVIGLLLASVIVFWRGFWWQRAALVAGTALMLALGISDPATRAGLRYDGDTAYSRYQVLDSNEDPPRRFLQMDNEAAQSGIYLDDLSEPAFAYVQRFLDAAAAGPAPAKVLVIGGGAFTLPRLLHDKYPNARIDVVEIDPKLSQIAQTYFGYKPHPKIRVINEDGRTYINAATAKYDLIYVDAFTSLSPPFQLTTTEAARKLEGLISPQGAVVANVIASREGRHTRFGQAEVATYKQNFDLVTAAPVDSQSPAEDRQNIILVGGSPGSRATRITHELNLSSDFLAGGVVLTDDKAPVEQLTAP